MGASASLPLVLSNKAHQLLRQHSVYAAPVLSYVASIYAPVVSMCTMEVQALNIVASTPPGFVAIPFACLFKEIGCPNVRTPVIACLSRLMKSARSSEHVWRPLVDLLRDHEADLVEYGRVLDGAPWAPWWKNRPFAFTLDAAFDGNKKSLRVKMAETLKFDRTAIALGSHFVGQRYWSIVKH